MQKQLLFFFSFFVIIQKTVAQTVSHGLNVKTAIGYEKQDLDWSIAGNLSGQDPNVYSELKWKRTGGPATEASACWLFGKKLAAFGAYTHVFINSGTVSDHDYNGDNRTNEVYGSDFASDKGYANRWAAGIGYRLVDNARFSLIPFAGYGQSSQSLFILDHATNSGLNSTYRPVWKGLLAKGTASLKIADAWEVRVDLTYTQVKYAATADWNLIQSFQHPISYRHRANGYSVESGIGILYRIDKCIGLALSGSYSILQTGTGTDELYLSDGSISRTRLNGVRAGVFRLSAGLSFIY